MQKSAQTTKMPTFYIYKKRFQHIFSLFCQKCSINFIKFHDILRKSGIDISYQE